VLARAAVAVGANGLFIETHPQPEEALSDGPNMIPLKEMAATLRQLLKVFKAIK
jgi:2-dehydro-3-deoxyphosphooctonate aldolase (KDO 8-P synthase)